MAAQIGKGGKGRLAGFQNAGIGGIGPAPVAQPADAQPRNIRVQRRGKGLPGAGVRIGGGRHRQHFQQPRQIFGAARHGAIGGQLMQERVAHRIRRHQAETGAKAVNVAEGRRVAQ